MKITAFAGSNSSRSINKKLVEYTLKAFPEFEIKLLDLNDFEMPIYSMDREKNTGIPEKAYEFRTQLAQSDAIICSLAEHNRAYTVAFKNIFDWCSRIDMNIFANKPMLLMSTSPGGFGGGNVMNLAEAFFPKCGANIIETFSLPSFHQNFPEADIVNEELKKEHAAKVVVFKAELRNA
ncbi:NADPH-dependent FMN reductase [Mariniradius sediminis]|uniref:NAD(P)H-dependent oxidoreductase n=1 Tax=Mariniradius sediminis TaxID=2909237 RepID=A0ABS9BPS6_9BACT|nr:NAD(P)H-dependent oxidoreductase [Mariniradius sediminis]MCF1750043.1 NAD(P)H-dependent oxidoreductase [Mariniradius sediminis]